ncbi:MAG: serine/threonine-protein kinase [Cyanobacteria bacterium J06634_5]
MSKPIIPSGTLIDNRYLIQKVLGQGGLGRTYLAFDTRRFDEACVLKEFAPSGSGKHSIQKSRALFKREAEILYHVQHPQIPDFLACFEDDGRLFLVQEYVNGKTYSDLLKAHRKQNSVFSEQEVIDWLNHLLPVLNYIHQCGIIHRDISPDNIMLPQNNHLPVLIDFGVGKQIVEASQLGNGNEDAEEISYVGKMSLVGKVGYAPHEQIRLGVCSPSSDLYALGVTAVVLLTCKDPSTLMNQYSLKWEWRTRANVSSAFGEIIDKMLADTPADRYQTAPEVSADLASLQAAEKDGAEGGAEEITVTAADGLNVLPETFSESLDFPQTTLRPNVPMPTMVSPAASAPPTNLPGPPASSLSPAFIEQCRQKLSEYIGPMAAFVVDEAIALHHPQSPNALVEALIPDIPSSEEAIAFRKHLLK